MLASRSCLLMDIVDQLQESSGKINIVDRFRNILSGIPPWELLKLISCRLKSGVLLSLFSIVMIAMLSNPINLEIILFSAAVLFQVVTLPVEFNASLRAIKILDESGLLYEDEVYQVRKLLTGPCRSGCF